MRTESDTVHLLDDTEDELTIAVQTAEEAIDQITLFLGGIAGVSPPRDSIGIDSISVVSVTERTREIGIVRTVGARRPDVIRLLPVETLVSGIIGSVPGVVAGVRVRLAAIWLHGRQIVYVGWVLVAVGVGVLVISSPDCTAWRGARVDPTEALRRE